MSFNPKNFFLKRVGKCDFKIIYRNFLFMKRETLFGRGRECDFILKNMRCSLIHCKITFENGRLFIEDSSTAGTFVNNKRIRNEKVELHEGSIIGMGADPSRPEHVDKTNFYIYKVETFEAPIYLDSSDDEQPELDETIPITKHDNKENQHVIDLDDSDEILCMDSEEKAEDLTLKIEEHLSDPVQLEMNVNPESVIRLKDKFLGTNSSENLKDKNTQNEWISSSLCPNVKPEINAENSKNSDEESKVAGQQQKHSNPTVPSTKVTSSNLEQRNEEQKSSTTGPDQPKALTTEEIKSKTNALRHYGMKTTKLIEIPLNQSADLLDEVANPKNPEQIYWKSGIAVVKTAKNLKKKRGKRKKNADDEIDNEKLLGGGSNILSGSDSKCSLGINSPGTSKKIILETDKISSSGADDKYPSGIDSKNHPGTAKKSFSRVNRISSSGSESKSSSGSNSKSSSGTDIKKQTGTARKSTSASNSNDSSRTSAKNNLATKKINLSAIDIIYEPITDNKSKSGTKSSNSSTANFQNHSKTEIKSINRQSIESTAVELPSNSNAQKSNLYKFPDFKDDNSKKQEAPKPKIPKRRESIINFRNPKTIAQNKQDKNQSKIKKRTVTLYKELPKADDKFECKFPNIYKSINDKTEEAPAPPIVLTIKKRRQSVFDEQAQLIPKDSTFSERENALRRWHQNTTKLIEPTVNPCKKRRSGRPKLNEDDKIKQLVGKGY